MLKEKRYKTKDIKLASVLVSLGHKVAKTEPHEDGRSRYFVFWGAVDTLEGIEKSYMKKELVIEPWVLFANLESLKGLVRQPDLSYFYNNEDNETRTTR